MFYDSILIGKTSILRVGHISISNLLNLTFGGTTWGMLKNWQVF